MALNFSVLMSVFLSVALSACLPVCHILHKLPQTPNILQLWKALYTKYQWVDHWCDPPIPPQTPHMGNDLMMHSAIIFGTVG